MAKFEVGQRVELAFNPVRPDPRVPDQVNGKFPGTGEYQTKADEGEILEIHDRGEDVAYLVLVDLHRVDNRNPKKPRLITSRRQRLVPEAGLSAL